MFSQVLPPDTSDHDVLMVWIAGILLFSLFGLAGIVIPLLVGNRKRADATLEQATQVNDAINNRHRYPPDENGQHPPKALDAIYQIKDDLQEVLLWKKTWEDLPRDISTDGGLTRRFDKIDHTLEGCHRAISDLHKKVEHHIVWEETVGNKYPPDDPRFVPEYPAKDDGPVSPDA
jgi:hypothetical protein